MRLSKTYDGATANYHYFQGQLMYETVGDTVTALYIRSSTGSLQAVKLYQGGVYNWYYYHYNAHGDVTGVTDSTGNVYRQYFYDPYGNLIQVQNGSGVSVDINTDTGFNHAYTYAGYRYDKETGLYFLNARYYAPGIGLFLTKDTVVGILFDPQTTNRYVYTGGNPISYIDPTGHMWMDNAGVGGLRGALAKSAAQLQSLEAEMALLRAEKVALRQTGGKGGGSAVHGNSKSSTKVQHGYEIFEKENGDVVKTGISGRSLNKNGTSPRANSQVNSYNNLAGYNKYEARVVEPNISGRQAALDWESNNAMRLWEEGNSMSKHQIPAPWNQ